MMTALRPIEPDSPASNPDPSPQLPADYAPPAEREDVHPLLFAAVLFGSIFLLVVATIACLFVDIGRRLTGWWRRG